MPVADEQNESFWEIQIPIAAAAVPAAAFWLIGLITPWLAKGEADTPVWVIGAMISLEVIGIVAMAVVLLIRFDIASNQLTSRTGGSPSAWRKTTLALAMAMLILFDTTVNLAAAFRGAAILLVLGIPAFLAYLALGRLTFFGLQAATQSRKP